MTCLNTDVVVCVSRQKEEKPLVEWWQGSRCSRWQVWSCSPIRAHLSWQSRSVWHVANLVTGGGLSRHHRPLFRLTTSSTSTPREPRLEVIVSCSAHPTFWRTNFFKRNSTRKSRVSRTQGPGHPTLKQWRGGLSVRCKYVSNFFIIFKTLNLYNETNYIVNK